MKSDASLSWRGRLHLAGVLGFLCLPELALLGFFSMGALLAAPAAAPRPADAVVVLGGDVSLAGRYAQGVELVRSGYAQRMILLYPGADQLRDARASLAWRWWMPRPRPAAGARRRPCASAWWQRACARCWW